VQDIVEPLSKPMSIARWIERPVLPDLERSRRFEQRVEIIASQRLEHHDLTLQARRQVIPHVCDHAIR
jgi:hypothetical protein